MTEFLIVILVFIIGFGAKATASIYKSKQEKQEMQLFMKRLDDARIEIPETEEQEIKRVLERVQAKLSRKSG
jgi:hypothetical protein